MNDWLDPSILGLVFQQKGCMPGQMTETNKDEGLGVRDEVAKGGVVME